MKTRERICVEMKESGERPCGLASRTASLLGNGFLAVLAQHYRLARLRSRLMMSGSFLEADSEDK